MDEFPYGMQNKVSLSSSVNSVKIAEAETELKFFMDALEILLEKMFELSQDYRGEVATVIQ